MVDEVRSGLGLTDDALTAAFRSALETYATGLTANFASATVAQPEDQLKAPVGALLVAAGAAAGRSVLSRTETRVDGVAGRPDLGVDADRLPVGNVELKAPGYGAQPAAFPDKRSREQFERFSALPNLLYTDGREWALYRYGELRGPVVTLAQSPIAGGAAGITDDDTRSLLDLLGTFLRWEPVVPSSARALAGLLAPLTRALRDEVLADVRSGGVMADLAAEWRATLFPDADDPTFADGYAQTFTYALLLARLEGAPAPLNAEAAARELDADHALLAQALRVLGQNGTREAIGMPVGLIERIVSAVDTAQLQAGKDPWLYFYEDFLAAYDPAQRNNRGVYYTPYEVVAAQVRLCNEVLVERFGKLDGFADPDVIALDPAAGTGTYPLTIAAHALDAAVERGGEGVRAEVAGRLGRNLNAFELLVGPYAVTHLRLSRTLVDAGANLPPEGVNVFLTDTLATPTHEGFAEQATLFQRKLAREQERASRIKDPSTHVTVVIGNPPYDRDESQAAAGARRKGGMVRYQGDSDVPGLIEDFLAPLRAAGGGGHAKNLYNDYVYFWRWAIWKTCEQTDDTGIVSFITASSYLTGPGFAGMREVMRRRFDELWLIDLGGEGRGTRKEANVFEGVLSPVVITFGIRRPDGPADRDDTPATVRYRRINGTRDEKLEALGKLMSLDDGDAWERASDGWGDHFVPAGTADFDSWPALTELMPWQHSGAQFKRSWPIAESAELLRRRWGALAGASAADRPAMLKESRDRTVAKVCRDLRDGSELPTVADLDRNSEPLEPVRYGFRSFDRQWCLPDSRLGDFLRPELWATTSDRQVFLTTLTTNPFTLGPALTATALLPDLHHFRGSFGAKDVLPVWRDRAATAANLPADLLDTTSSALRRPVTAEDLVAYIFGLLGTGAYTERFADELATSPARVPFTTDAALFAEVAAFGRDLLWWATYGERFQPLDSKGKLVRRLPPGAAKNTKAVPTDAAGYPEGYTYDPATKTLHVGSGEFGPLEPAVWDFEVSGLKVVQSWLAYRMRKRAGRKSSPLDDIRPEAWSFSTELVELLAVVEHFVAAEPAAAELLERVVTGDVLDGAELPEPTDSERKPPKPARAGKKADGPQLFS